MTTLLEAKTGIRQLAVKAQETVADDKLTNAEKKNVLDQIQVDSKAYSETITLHEQAQSLLAGGDAATETESKTPDNGRQVKSIGQQIIESAAYKGFVAATGQRTFSTELKTVNTIDEGTTFSGGFPTGMGGAAVVPDFLPGILPLLFRKLLIADLFAQGSTNSNQISYVKETAFQNNAAGVSEKGAKPQSDDTIARVIEQVGKVAHFMKVTDELIQDAPAYMSFLQNRLVFGVQYKEDGALLNDTGYPSVNGLLNRSGMQTTITKSSGTLAAPTLVIDAVYNQITNIRFNAFVEPDAVVMNPTDWQNIRLAKDANTQYYAGGPFTGAYGNGGYSNVDALWGLRVVITPAIASGTILVGSYQQCGQVFRRQGVTVEMTNSNVDDFENNLITVRAEERLALAVYRPAGFGQVAVTWA
jgi:HK97 family phage major capsid protein